MVWDEDGPPTYEEWNFKHRTHDGQIRHVNAVDGKITVQLFGSNEQYVVDIPVQELSFQGVGSSFQRAMPQTNSYARIGFGPQNNAYCVRLMTWNPSADNGMYGQLAALAQADRDAGGVTGFGYVWRDLAEGEFDLRSKGGAGYYFTEDGHALFEAGPTTIELDKNRFESTGNAGLWVRGGDGTEVRSGDVKRLLPGAFEETPAVVNPTGAPAPKEWSIEVGVPTPVTGTPTLTLYTEQAGDVRDDLGKPVLLAGKPVRYQETFYDAAGVLPTLTVTVDVLGNVDITQEDTAVPGGVKVNGGAASPLTVKFAQVDIEAGVGNAKLGAKGLVQLAGGGGSASDGVVLGSALSTWLTTQLSVLTAFGPSGPAVAPLVMGTQYSATVKASV